MQANFLTVIMYFYFTGLFCGSYNLISRIINVRLSFKILLIKAVVTRNRLVKGYFLVSIILITVVDTLPPNAIIIDNSIIEFQSLQLHERILPPPQTFRNIDNQLLIDSNSHHNIAFNESLNTSDISTSTDELQNPSLDIQIMNPEVSFQSQLESINHALNIESRTNPNMPKSIIIRPPSITLGTKHVTFSENLTI